MWVGILALTLVFAPPGPVVAGAAELGTMIQEDVALTPAEAELERQVRDVAKQLRCPVCRALSVYDSPSGMALEMQELIREKLRAGMTPEEVKAYFVERYGEWILLEPPAKGFNWSVWLAPIALILGGFAFIWMTARRWVARGQARAAELTGGREEAM